MTSAIVAAGVLGPHQTSRSQTAPTQSQLGRTPTPHQTGVQPDFADLAPAQLAPSDISMSWLSDSITGRSLAAIGTRIFYVVDSNRIESTVIGSDVEPQSLVSVPSCRTINQIAAAGDLLAYVETHPVGAPLDASGCGRPTSVAWSIWLSDLQGNQPRQVASGVRLARSEEIRLYPVHLALSASAYAYEVPLSPAQLSPFERVAVRSTGNNRLLWSAQTDGGVSDILLGGSRLAVVTDGALMTEARMELWTGDASHPQLKRVGEPAASASISEDGTYLAWDSRAPWERSLSTAQAALVVDKFDSGLPQNILLPAAFCAPEPLRPVVSSGLTGPIVAWYATVGRGAVYPAFLDAANETGVALFSVQSPAWIDLQGSILIWVSADLGGESIAFAADLARSGNPAP
ncbi:MAG TPA: hypothetical protein VJ258_05640 [Candidatus Limnocylindrales bacterium]|nr:hypothetical protein [Candidatus Limnocylindrales bacterium]